MGLHFYTYRFQKGIFTETTADHPFSVAEQSTHESGNVSFSVERSVLKQCNPSCSGFE
jgi:hypothetical protein